MRRIIKKNISRVLGMTLALSILVGVGSPIAVRAQEEQKMYSSVGSMEILSRRVSKADLYDDVPQEQKSVNDNNSVEVKNEVLNVNFNGTDVIDYVRFEGTELIPAERRVATGSEAIKLEYTASEVAAVDDWTNLKITSGSSVEATTATNFRGEGTEVVFRIPTEDGQKRTFTVYAGGHPHTGTITATTTLGEASLKAVAGGQIAESYSFTPNSSQIIEYGISYVGTGEELKVTLKITGTEGKNWAGISVAGAVLKGVEEAEKVGTPEIPQEDEKVSGMTVIKKVASNSSLFSSIPGHQKEITQDNPVAVQNEVITADFTTADVVDYIRFTGQDIPQDKGIAEGEKISFTANYHGIEAVSDWNNLVITYEQMAATTTATSFRGEDTQVVISVPTIEGEKRTLEIFAGGHPNKGTYLAKAQLGDAGISVTAGAEQLEEYSYTPESSQIVHYEISYVGTGEILVFTLSLNNTGGTDWAGIAVAGVVLRKDIATISPNKGYFNKSITDGQHQDLQFRLRAKEEVVLTDLSLGEDIIPQTGYTYNSETGTIVLKAEFMDTLEVGEYKLQLSLSDGTSLEYALFIKDATGAPRPYVKDSSTLSSQNLDDWQLWYQDEFDSEDGALDDWWEPSYLKWWNYSSESNENYNVLEEDSSAIDGKRGTDGKVLKQFVTPTMRADSIITRSDNFRNPGITLGVRDLNHNYASQNLMNYQHMPTDDRGATAYGYFEVRAKITGGSTANTVSGSTAWWFTGFQDASWQTHEVDMVEYGYGVGVDSLNGHFASPNHPWRDPFAGSQGRSWDSAKFGVGKPADDYHVYGIEWTPNGMNGYFDGELVWSKNISVNYRMLTWISLNAHAKDTYITDSKEHKFDYIRIWKTDALAQLEKEMVTRNVIQKLQPVDKNVATLAYAGVNGISSKHYQTWDPNFFNDNEEATSFKVMTTQERKTSARTPYHSEEYYLYLDWVKYNEEEIKEAQNLTAPETIIGSDGKEYTLASAYDVRRAKTVEAVELIVNRKAGYKTIDKASSNNSKADFVYNLTTQEAHLFPYRFDIEYSVNGVDQWTPLATDVVAEWNFNNSEVASFIVNVPRKEQVNHLRIHVKSVWDTNTNTEVSTENGFYIAEIKVYEYAKENAVQVEANKYYYNHALDAKVTVTDKKNDNGSEDINFPVTDVADGVYVNEFRSSGDSRTEGSGNRVDVNVPVRVLEEGEPQYINFAWDSVRTIDNFAMTIGYISSAPTKFALEYFENGEWKELNHYSKTDWNKDFEVFEDDSFLPVSTDKMRVKVISANDGLKIDRADGVQTGYGIRVCVAPGYYSIAEIELKEEK